MQENQTFLKSLPGFIHFTEELECGVIDGLCKYRYYQLPCACQLVD